MTISKMYYAKYISLEKDYVHTTYCKTSTEKKSSGIKKKITQDTHKPFRRNIHYQYYTGYFFLDVSQIISPGDLEKKKNQKLSNGHTPKKIYIYIYIFYGSFRYVLYMRIKCMFFCTLTMKKRNKCCVKFLLLFLLFFFWLRGEFQKIVCENIYMK